MVAIVDSFSQTYGGAYSVGGFMKAHWITGLSGAWEDVTDPSGHMPRIRNGGTIEFVRIMLPIPAAKEQAAAPNPNFGLVAEYQGTGGNEVWTTRTGATGTTAGDAWPSFRMQGASGVTGVENQVTYFVEYGRVHSVPK